jgi:hypothetical protein
VLALPAGMQAVPVCVGFTATTVQSRENLNTFGWFLGSGSGEVTEFQAAAVVAGRVAGRDARLAVLELSCCNGSRASAAF